MRAQAMQDPGLQMVEYSEPLLPLSWAKLQTPTHSHLLLTISPIVFLFIKIYFTFTYNFVFLIVYLFYLFKERGERREKERERNIDVREKPICCLSYAPQPGNQTHNPGMYSDQESNPPHFDSRDGAQPTEPHWARQYPL